MSFVCTILCALLLVGYIKAECDHGWLHYGDSCYLFAAASLTWYEASSVCTAHHAYLASIETADENTFLKQEAMVRKGSFWLGGMDDIVEGEWLWSSSNKHFGFTDWGPTQPDNVAGGQDCVLLWDTIKWQWDDAGCNIRLHFICEREYPDLGDMETAGYL